jgi:uridine kinase
MSELAFIQLHTLRAALPRRGATLLIGVDGPGGAGKSVFARALAVGTPPATVVEMDDFFRPSSERLPGDPRDKQVGADFDWPRLCEQVLRPLAAGATARYQRYDWGTDRLAEWHAVPPGGMVIVEGVYCTRDELAGFYDFTIWIECPRELRLVRGIARDGAGSREIWERDWMVAEELYIAAQRPRERADLVLDGSGRVPHDPLREAVVTVARRQAGHGKPVRVRKG